MLKVNCHLLCILCGRLHGLGGSSCLELNHQVITVLCGPHRQQTRLRGSMICFSKSTPLKLKSILLEKLPKDKVLHVHVCVCYPLSFIVYPTCDICNISTLFFIRPHVVQQASFRGHGIQASLWGLSMLDCEVDVHHIDFWLHDSTSFRVVCKGILMLCFSSWSDEMNSGNTLDEQLLMNPTSSLSQKVFEAHDWNSQTSCHGRPFFRPLLDQLCVYISQQER